MPQTKTSKVTQARLAKFQRGIDRALAERQRKKAERDHRRKKAKILSSLRTFANAAGVTIRPCGPGWGGRWGFGTPEAPGSMTCGYKTVTAAREAWAIETFGQKAAEALFVLLDHPYVPTT